jgi:putative transposase
MPRKRYKPEQIIAILREAERAGNNEETCRKHGVSNQTFYRWKKMYGGMGAPEIRRIKELEQENRRLKQLAGDQALTIQLLKDTAKKKGWD